MSFCSFLSKLTLVIINILFWALAGGLVFLSSWIFIEYSKYGHLGDIFDASLLPAYVILAVGIVLFVLGIIGCVGAVKEQKCLMGLYFSLLVVAFVGVVAGVALAYAYRGKIDANLHDAMKTELDKYGNDTAVTDAIDIMQHELHCCGVDNVTDWLETPWYDQPGHNESYPKSCCKNRVCYYNETYSSNVTDQHLYHQGCYAKMKNQFVTHISVIYGVVAACAAVLVFGMVSACCLLRTRRQQDGFIYRDLSDTDGMRV